MFGASWKKVPLGVGGVNPPVGDLQICAHDKSNTNPTILISSSNAFYVSSSMFALASAGLIAAGIRKENESAGYCDETNLAMTKNDAIG